MPNTKKTPSEYTAAEPRPADRLSSAASPTSRCWLSTEPRCSVHHDQMPRALPWIQLVLLQFVAVVSWRKEAKLSRRDKNTHKSYHPEPEQLSKMISTFHLNALNYVMPPFNYVLQSNTLSFSSSVHFPLFVLHRGERNWIGSALRTRRFIFLQIPVGRARTKRRKLGQEENCEAWTTRWNARNTQYMKQMRGVYVSWGSRGWGSVQVEKFSTLSTCSQEKEYDFRILPLYLTRKAPPTWSGGCRCGVSVDKLYRARSRLYRTQILQVNMRVKALAEIYTMHSFAQLCNLNCLYILPKKS